ncbi:hypothetical protein L6164_033360 [Bauhinia variegata]|uniref:Uncharacterized protein n=1 Tax=Bauhinia variegata TaxID=167791 RepID=A0ACB9KS07_BAUVA|nr:hypothetical protein L6164_033360 [Bauhinia variegata]
MDNLATWNIRGMNKASKNKEATNFCRQHNIGILGPLKTKVKVHTYTALHTRYWSNWESHINLGAHPNDRIWLLWRNESYILTLVSSSSQVVYCQVMCLYLSTMFFLSVVYAFNSTQERVEFWEELKEQAKRAQGPWIVLGDFNYVFKAEKRIGGSYVTTQEIRDFANWTHSCGLLDLRWKGSKFSWNNKHAIEDRIYSKIHRA